MLPISNKVRSLLAAILGFCLFASTIILKDIPQRMEHEEHAQLAIQKLDAIRRPILEIKALENRQLHSSPNSQISSQVSNQALSRLNRADDEAENILQRYLELAQYNPQLLLLVKDFARSYSHWVEKERWIFQHLLQTDNDLSQKINHYMIADQLLLEALAVLAKGEEPLHADIGDGQQAVRVAQIAAAVFMIYLFLTIILFQRLSARQLAAREQDLDITLHSIGDAVISTDMNGLVTRMNPVALKLTGCSYARAQGRPLSEVFVIEHATTRKPVTNPVDIVLEKGQIVGLANHTVLVSRDGSRYQIADSAAPIKTESGEIRGVVLVFHDVTQSYDIQQTANDQATRLNHIVETSMDAIIVADSNGSIIEWNAQAEKTFGWAREKILGNYLHETIIPPQYRKLHLQGIERFKKTGQAKILNQRVELSALHKNGSEFPVELTISKIDIKEGYLYSAFVRDMSKMKQAEKELKLAATTFYAHSGIVITDPQKRILRINPAMEEISGYSAEEMIGEYPSILKSGRQDDNFYKKMWQQINATDSWQGELWNKRKDGSLYAEFLTITAVKSSTGEIINYVGTSYDITERKFAEDKVEQFAYRDELTNLANRRLLLDRLNHEISVAARHQTYGAVLYLDLDRFKNLNDALGHPIGDELLRQVARRLTELVRAEDTVSRLGGDEFVIMLSAANQELKKASLEASNVVDKIKASLTEAFDLHGYQYFLNTSIGIVVFPEGEENADDVLKHADSALYRAKEDGRNTSCFYKPSMQQDADARLRLEKDIRHALKNNELALHYQPQVNIDGRVTGAEALLRWHHPQRGMIPPSEFIPLAEDTGLILDIGNWVFQQASKQMARWCALGICPNTRSLAINVSPRQFHQTGFIDDIINTIEKANIEAGCIELEITESLLMDRIDDVVDKLSQLRVHGIRIAIDDFGTGYSSLSYLKNLPLDKLKIDQSFVRDISVSNNDAAIVDTIISMSKHLGLSVVAEGVETKEQLDFLYSKGCKTFQGYYFSKAVDEEQMIDILRANTVS